MKICPVCKQTYTDDNLNFCLNDGGTLTRYVEDDAPPTVMMNQARTTQQNWQNYESPAWGNQPLQNHQSAPFQQNHPFGQANYQTQNQTLPTVSLVLGIFGILLTCCYGGIPFGAAALVTGFIGFKNVNENPQRYGGRGLAIAGMVMGGIGLLFGLGIIIIALAANL